MPMITVALSVIGVATLATLVLHGRLVRRQHEIARESWERDGSPPGFAWSPREASVVRSWARTAAYFRLLVGTPPWIVADGRARVLRARFRISSLVAFAAWAWFLSLILGRR